MYEDAGRLMGRYAAVVAGNLGRGLYRVLFCLVDSTLVLMHGFMKKTEKTPDQDVEIARERQKDVKRP